MSTYISVGVCIQSIFITRKCFHRLLLEKKYLQKIWGVLACIARRQEFQTILLKVFYFVPFYTLNRTYISLKLSSHSAYFRF